MTRSPLDDQEQETSTMTDSRDEPARLAALDQELAALNDRLARYAGKRKRSDIVTTVIAVAVAAAFAIARPHVPWWLATLLALGVAIEAAGSFIQGRMLKLERDENARLRVGER